MDARSYQTKIDIRYRDTDSMGHVSSTIYYDYLQSAYLEYMHEILAIPKSEKLPQIMVKTGCEYVAQAAYGDTLVVSSRVCRIGGKSFEMEHIMRVDKEDAKIVAKASSVHVMFDYKTQVTCPVSDDFRQRVESFQGAI